MLPRATRISLQPFSIFVHTLLCAVSSLCNLSRPKFTWRLHRRCIVRMTCHKKICNFFVVMLSNPECTLNHACIKAKNPRELSVNNATLYYQPTLKEKQRRTWCSISVLHLAVYSWLQPGEQKREIKSRKRCCRRRQQKPGCTVEELPVGRRRQSVLPPPLPVQVARCRWVQVWVMWQLAALNELQTQQIIVKL